MRLKSLGMQRKVNRLLTRRLLFSFYWPLGFGSVYAIYCARQSRRIIRNSECALSGGRKSIVSLIVGCIGASFWLVIAVMQLAAILEVAEAGCRCESSCVSSGTGCVNY